MDLVIEMVSRKRTNLFTKVGCFMPMFVLSILPHAESGRNDHRENASHFTTNSDSGLTMALLGKIAPGDIAIGINALQEAILACQEFEMSKSVTIDSYKYVLESIQSLTRLKKIQNYFKPK